MWSRQLHFYVDGDWVKVDDIYVGLKGSGKFFETKDFLIDPATPSNLVVQLNIKISGKSFIKINDDQYRTRQVM